MCEDNTIFTAFDQIQCSKKISTVKMRSLLKQVENCMQCPENIDGDSHNEYDCRCWQTKQINLRNLIYYFTAEH